MPLIAADQWGTSPEVLHMLIEAGANPQIKDAKSQTALDDTKENVKMFQRRAYYELRDVRAR